MRFILSLLLTALALLNAALFAQLKKESKLIEIKVVHLDDPEMRERIIAKAIDVDMLRKRMKEDVVYFYAPNNQMPYTGWIKWMHGNAQIKQLALVKDGTKQGPSITWYLKGQKTGEYNWKDGKQEGVAIRWYTNGQKKSEEKWKGGKLISAVCWKPNGEECTETRVNQGAGVFVHYNFDGTIKSRKAYPLLLKNFTPPLPSSDGLVSPIAEKEFYIIKSLAEGGGMVAQFNLAVTYARGEGVPQDHKQAVKWFRLAAEQGNAKAQFNLGKMYANGEGVPKDLVHAYAWYTISSANGEESARRMRDGIVLTKAQREEGYLNG